MTHCAKNKVLIIPFLTLLLLVVNTAFSQHNNYRLDSIRVNTLIDTAKSHKNDSLAIKLYKEADSVAKKINCKGCYAKTQFNLGIYFFEGKKYDSAKTYFNNSLKINKQFDNKKDIIKDIYYLGFIYRQLSNNQKSISSYNTGLEIANAISDTTYIAEFNYYLGDMYVIESDFVKATVSYMSALSTYEKTNDTVGVISTLVNLGLIFSYDNNIKSAIEFTQRAMKLSKLLNNNGLISICANNIGDFYSSAKDHSKALNYFKQSLELDIENDDIEGMAISLNNVGDSYKELGDTVLAISYYTKSINISVPNNYPVAGITFLNLGEVYLAQNNLSEAIFYLKKVKAYINISNYSESLLKVYELLSECYARKGSYQNAFEYSKKYNALYDSTYNASKSKSIQNIIESYDGDKRAKEITTLKDQKHIDSKTIIILVFVIIIIIVIVLIILLFQSFKRKSLKTIENHKKYYEKILEYSEGFIIVIGEDGIAKYISPSYERIIGRSNKDRVGKNSFEFIHKDDVEYVKSEFGKLIKDGFSRSVEFRIENAFGEWMYVFAHGQNLLNDKTIQGIVVNFWNITDRKKNEGIIRENEMRYRQIFNSFPDVYFETDLDGTITEMSPSVSKILGYDRDELIGTKSTEYGKLFSDWDTIDLQFDTTSLIHDYDTKIRCQDGKMLDCSISSEHILSEDGSQPLGIKGTIRDISLRIKNQQLLKESELKLQESNKAKEKLFSIIAHDLIGPIGTNKAIVDMIVSQIDILGCDEVATLITSLKPSLDSTYALTENLLSWARIQQNRIEVTFENVSLKSIIENAIVLLQGQAKQKNISVKFIDNEINTVFGDKNQLDVAIRNLLSNAIKFSHNDSEITISILTVNDMLEIRISDTGIGMSRKQLLDILQGKGTHVRKGTNNEKGTGFGIYIVKEFVNNNNGTLSAISEEGKGTTFVISLPLVS